MQRSMEVLREGPREREIWYLRAGSGSLVKEDMSNVAGWPRKRGGQKRVFVRLNFKMGMRGGTEGPATQGTPGDREGTVVLCDSLITVTVR